MSGQSIHPTEAQPHFRKKTCPVPRFNHCHQFATQKNINVSPLVLPQNEINRTLWFSVKRKTPSQVQTTAKLGRQILMIETATHILRSVFGKTPQQRIAKAPDASITDNPTTTVSVKFTPLARPLKRDLSRICFPGRPGFCSSTKFADVSKPEVQPRSFHQQRCCFGVRISSMENVHFPNKKTWELDQTRQAWQRRSQKKLNSKRVAASYQQTVPRSSWIKKLPNNESKATSPKPDCRTIVPARRPVKRKGLGLRDTRFTYLTWDIFHKWTHRLGRKKCLQEDHAERSKNKENRPRKHSKITQSQH